jgi:hypothetical protein
MRMLYWPFGRSSVLKTVARHGMAIFTHGIEDRYLSCTVSAAPGYQIATDWKTNRMKVAHHPVRHTG